MKSLKLLSLITIFWMYVAIGFAQTMQDTTAIKMVQDTTKTGHTSDVKLDSMRHSEAAKMETDLYTDERRYSNVVGIFGLIGPSHRQSSGPVDQYYKYSFRSTVDNLLYASNDIRLAEIDPDRLGTVGTELIAMQEAGITEFVGRQKEQGNWIGVNYLVTQQDSRDLLFSMDLWDNFPGWLRNMSESNSSNTVLNIALLDVESGGKTNFLVSNKGYRDDPLTYASQVTQNVESLVNIDNQEQRELYARIQNYRVFSESALNTEFMALMKAFAVLSTGLTAHALIQGSVFNKIVVGGAYGGFSYFLWTADRSMRKVRNETYEKSERLIEEYEQQYGPYQ